MLHALLGLVVVVVAVVVVVVIQGRRVGRRDDLEKLENRNSTGAMGVALGRSSHEGRCTCGHP